VHDGLWNSKRVGREEGEGTYYSGFMAATVAVVRGGAASEGRRRAGDLLGDDR
jgi:hypothetical protein